MMSGGDWAKHHELHMTPYRAKPHGHEGPVAEETASQLARNLIEEVEDLKASSPKFPVSEFYPVGARNVDSEMTQEKYEEMYKRSLSDDTFWDQMAKTHLRWLAPYRAVKINIGDMKNVQWFIDGKLNASDICVDRWAESHPDKIALIIEPDDAKDRQKITFKELRDRVCQVANLLKAHGVKKGDVVTIYLPMMAEIAYSMLACARIGAIHSVVFGGYSAVGLADRIKNSRSKILITADYGRRGGKHIPLKAIADAAMQLAKSIEHCLVFTRDPKTAFLVPDRDVDASKAMTQMRPFCPLEPVDAEDYLFVLYTSGSTGIPKGIMHTTAGYLLFAAMTHKYSFDLRPHDMYACVADCGWITGHTYVIYGPLANGATTLMMETLPTYPDPARYWRIIEELKITQFYTAPTAIRTLMKYGPEWTQKHDLSSLRVIGSVGEPLNAGAWHWIYQHVGKEKCSIVDTYWQTETGGHVITSFPGAFPQKPGSAAKPFFGIKPAILDPITGQEKTGNDIYGVLCIKSAWPAQLRSIVADHRRLNKTYFDPFPNYYFTGDGVYRDKDGYLWITGRIDDTLNVSGHRIATAEVESALSSAPQFAESAVVGYPHPVKGTGIFCFIVLKSCCTNSLEQNLITLDELQKTARQQIRDVIGAMATPDIILFVKALPKTRSGKILRRILRKIASGQKDELGDISALANPDSLEFIIPAVEAMMKPKT